MKVEIRAELPDRGMDLRLRWEAASGDRATAGRAVSGGLGVIGANGAGKSTLLGLLGGQVLPTDGRIAVDDEVLTEVRAGRVVTAVPVHRRRIGLLAQEPLLLPHLDVLGNLRFAARSSGLSRAESARSAAELLERWQLGHLAQRRPGTLSGGQAQRVAIVRALAARPRLLLLDEPLAALDVDAAPRVRDLLAEVLSALPAIVVTHDPLEAVTLSRDLLVLEDGGAAELGPTEQVLSRPTSGFGLRFAGLGRVTGRLDGERVVLPDGERLRGRPCPEDPPRPGTPVHGVVRPAAVGITRADEPEGTLDPSGAATGSDITSLPRTVLALEARGDLVRVRTEDLAADIPAPQAAHQGLGPGTPLRLHVPAAELLLYPNRSDLA